jgi:uncharacterized protein (UPF0276 family)
MKNIEGIRYLNHLDSADINYIFVTGDSPPDKGKPEVDTT